MRTQNANLENEKCEPANTCTKNANRLIYKEFTFSIVTVGSSRFTFSESINSNHSRSWWLRCATHCCSASAALQWLSTSVYLICTTVTIGQQLYNADSHHECHWSCWSHPEYDIIFPPCTYDNCPGCLHVYRCRGYNHPENKDHYYEAASVFLQFLRPNLLVYFSPVWCACGSQQPLASLERWFGPCSTQSTQCLSNSIIYPTIFVSATVPY